MVIDVQDDTLIVIDVQNDTFNKIQICLIFKL